MMKRRTIAKIISLVAFIQITVCLSRQILYWFQPSEFEEGFFVWFDGIKESFFGSFFGITYFFGMILPFPFCLISIITKRKTVNAIVNIISIIFSAYPLIYFNYLQNGLYFLIIKFIYISLLLASTIIFPKKVKNESK